MGELREEIEKITPFQIARLRQKRVEHSTRDKAVLLSKVTEIEGVLDLMEKN
tara:strand:- start:271 stop:426 length:156 start_codon:yes stop_codon:yes gene_type:complete